MALLRSIWVLIPAILLAISPVTRASGDDSYLKKTETELKEWSGKVETLQRQSEKAGHQSRMEFERQMRVVRRKIKVARRKLLELRDSNQVTWNDLRQSADEAVRDVQQAYRTAKSFLNQGKHKEE